MKLRYTVLVFSLLLFYPGCTVRKPSSHIIRLKWNKSFEGENWNYSRTGFLWNLSFLGAELPKGCVDRMIILEPDSEHFVLNIDYAGFNNNAIKSLEVILDTIIASNEYKANGCIDMGKFIMLTQNSSWHYYKITGVAEDLKSFKRSHKLDNAQQFLVSSSGVTEEDRLITLRVGETWDDIAFIAEVGNKDPLSGKFVSTEIEVFDIMKNGQLRFAVYDEKGKLKQASNPKHSIAGKPSKCLWCHETSVQPLHYGEYENPGYISASDFLCNVEKSMKILEMYRMQLISEIDFSKTHHHTYSELNYIGFMNPTMERISNELDIDMEAAKSMTKNFDQHEITNFPFYYREYPYFGVFKGAFDRKQVDALVTFGPIKTPNDPLEMGDYEPNFFKQNPNMK